MLQPKAIEFIDMHCAGPLRENRAQALSDLLDKQRQDFIDEVSIYLAMRHNGVTTADAKMVNHLINTTY